MAGTPKPCVFRLSYSVKGLAGYVEIICVLFADEFVDLAGLIVVDRLNPPICPLNTCRNLAVMDELGVQTQTYSVSGYY